MYRVSKLLVSVALFYLAGCAQGSQDLSDTALGGKPATAAPPLSSRGVSITSPLDGQVIVSTTVEVSGSAPNGEPIFINGVEVEVVDGRYSHLINLPKSGTFAIEVSALDASESRMVIVDRDGPAIEVTEPMRGAFYDLKDGLRLTVSGTARDPSGIESLSMNGTALSIGPDGSFSAEIEAKPGVNLVRIESIDANGDKTVDVRAAIFGDLAPFEEPVQDALSLRMDREALDYVAEAFSQRITPDVFSNLGGSVQQGNFDIRKVSISETEVKLHPGQGVLGLELRLYGLKLDFEAVFDGMELKGDIDANPATIRLDLRIDTDGFGGIDLQILRADAEMDQFDFDVEGPLGLFDWVIRGIVRKELENGLADAMRGMVISDLLGADALNQTGEFLGYPAAYKMALTQISIDPNGIDIVLDSGLSASVQSERMLPGYLSHPKRVVHGHGDTMIRFSLADDFLNMLLAQVWLTSGLKLDVGALLKAADSESIPFELKASSAAALLGALELLDFVDGDADVGLTVETHAPPMVEFVSDERPKVRIDVPELQLNLSADINGEETVWAKVVVHLSVEVSRDVNGTLGFEISSEVDVIDAPVFPISEDDVAGPLSTVFNVVFGLLAEVGQEGSPLGDFASLGGLDSMNPGLNVENFSLRLNGDEGGYLTFGLDLAVRLLPSHPMNLDIIQTEISPINGRTYHLLEASTWTEAESMAQTLGGHLATIRSRDENRWVLNTFGSFQGQNRDIWIGLNDARREGQWEWSSGEAVDYTNFDRRQPDNGVEEKTGGINEDFVHIYGDRSERRDGRWNDGHDLIRAPYSRGFHGLVEVFEAPKDVDEEEPESNDAQTD